MEETFYHIKNYENYIISKSGVIFSLNRKNKYKLKLQYNSCGNKIVYLINPKTNIASSLSFKKIMNNTFDKDGNSTNIIYDPNTVVFIKNNERIVQIEEPPPHIFDNENKLEIRNNVMFEWFDNKQDLQRQIVNFILDDKLSHILFKGHPSRIEFKPLKIVLFPDRYCEIDPSEVRNIFNNILEQANNPQYCLIYKTKNHFNV